MTTFFSTIWQKFTAMLDETLRKELRKCCHSLLYILLGPVDSLLGPVDSLLDPVDSLLGLDLDLIDLILGQPVAIASDDAI